MGMDAVGAAEATALRACAITEDLEAFDLLIDDLEDALGSAWGELSFAEAEAFLAQPEAEALEFGVVTLAEGQGDALARVRKVVAGARKAQLPMLLIARAIGPSDLHELMKAGLTGFLPYPIPEGEFVRKVAEMRAAAAPAAPAPAPAPAAAPSAAVRPLARAGEPGRAATGGHDAVVLAVQGLAGGTGSTTLAVNLAWELASIEKPMRPRVCVIDFDLQFGAVATALDVDRSDIVTDLITDIDAMDDEALDAALKLHGERLHVLAAPPEMLPFELVGPPEIERLIELVRTNFDYVVIDMPSAVISWTETVLNAAHVVFAPIELDMRSAQNAVRMVRALKAEGLPFDKLRYVLNRAPKLTDLGGRARVKRLSEGLDVQIDILLPDGGRQITEASDQGEPLGVYLPKSPVRREIAKLAQQIHATNTATVAAA